MGFIIQNIWYILIAIVVLLVGGGLLVMKTNFTHKMMDWLRPNSDKYVSAKVFCEDKQIRDRRLMVGRYCVTDSKKSRAFHLVHELLMSLPGSNKQFLALTERDDFPIDFQGKLSKEQRVKYPSAQRVFIDTTADIRSNASKESAKNMMGISLSLIAMAGALVFVVMAIIVFWKGQA